MGDVKDILGLTKFSSPPDRSESKEKKEKAKRPDGISREAYALLGSHPIIATQALLPRKGDIKSRPKATSTLTYQWRPFKNPARTDTLQLHHWVKLHKGREDQEGEYQYAKFNKKAQVYRFNDEEWETFIKGDSGDWTREETEYLLDMCERFDLRFIVIADRYEYSGKSRRSVEDLKNRYYKVARALLIGREGNAHALANHIIVKFPYNQALEEDRKAQLAVVLTRTLKSEKEETKILEEAQQIETQRQKEQTPVRPAPTNTGTPTRPATAPTPAAAPAGPTPSEGRPTKTPVPASTNGPPDAPSPSSFKFPQEFSNTVPLGTCSLLAEDLQPFIPAAPGVYARGANCLEMAAKQMKNVSSMNGGPRVQKGVEATLLELGCNSPPSLHTRATAGAFLALKAEVIAYHTLKRSMHSGKTPGGDGLKRKKK